MELTQERLKELFHYDPEFGNFTRLISVSSLARAGHVAGSRNSDGYLLIAIDGKRYKAHRLAFLYMTGVFPKDQVDHINGDGADNSWANLRECTLAENQQNRRKPSNGKHSKHIGVSFDRSNGWWNSYIRANGVSYSKAHRTEKEAIEWRIEMKARMHTFQPTDRA